MIKSKTEILESIKQAFQDDTSDSTLSFIEDVTDTINDLESKVNDSTDWKKMYEDNDKEWREKYKERFFSSPVNPSDSVPSSDVDDAPMSYEDLFSTK